MMTQTPPETQRVSGNADITVPSVKSQIAEILGESKLERKITASNVWAKNWRVNVWLREESRENMFGKWTISDSFFVTTDENGWIVSSDPKLPSND